MESDESENMEDLLTPRQAAVLFGVSTKTLSRWATLGLLHPYITPGGHRRFKSSEVEQLKNRHLDGRSEN